MIYLLVFVFLLIPVVKYDLMAGKGGEKVWYAVSLVVLILLAGLRYRVGTDTLMYMGLFDDCPKLDELKYFDFDTALYNPAWYIFNAFCKSVVDDFAFFQIVHATIVNVVFFRFFRRNCPKYYFSAILLYYYAYFCYFNMEVMRESLCICILLLAVDFLYERKWIPYMLLGVCAVYMHFSAAIMFCIPFLFIFKRRLWIWAPVLFTASFIAMRLIDVPSLVIGYLDADSSQLYDLIDKYLDRDINLFGMIGQVMKLLPVIGLLFLAEKVKLPTKYDFRPLLLGNAVVCGFAMNLGICERFYNYFVPFVIVCAVSVVYEVITVLKARNFQVSYLVMCLSVGLLMFNYTRYYTKDLSDEYPDTRFVRAYYPYHSVLNPVRDDHRENFIENYRDVAIMF